MSNQQKHYAWLNEVAEIVNNENEMQFEENIAVATVVSAICENEEINAKRKRACTRKRFWVHPIYQLRPHHGFYHAVLPTLSMYEPKFRNFLRMSLPQFEKLLRMVEPYITKRTVTREPIAPAARLAMTLRFLASGDSLRSISMQHLVGHTTAAIIIAETCQVIWNCLSKEMLSFPLLKNAWLRKARDFEEKWNFNHCIGAINGKHVVIQCPDNGASHYFNYKHNHSIVLMAICDANYMFTFVDIGAYGRRSDGGILKGSKVGRKFYTNDMNLPDPEKLTVDGNPLPYVLVGDEAFQLTDFSLRPYPGRGGLNQERNIYNYRLSRARRVIVNTFGILVNRWRILRGPIESTVENTIKIVQAAVCLHNWLRKHDLEENDYIRNNMVDREGPDGYVPGE